MTEFWSILAFFLIGVPGGAFVVLQLMAAHKRQILAVGWNAGELQRRGRRIADLEQQTVADRQTMAELMLKISALRMSVERLEKVIGQSTPAPTKG